MDDLGKRVNSLPDEVLRLMLLISIKEWREKLIDKSEQLKSCQKQLTETTTDKDRWFQWYCKTKDSTRKLECKTTKLEATIKKLEDENETLKLDVQLLKAADQRKVMVPDSAPV